MWVSWVSASRKALMTERFVWMWLLDRQEPNCVSLQKPALENAVLQGNVPGLYSTNEVQVTITFLSILQASGEHLAQYLSNFNGLVWWLWELSQSWTLKNLGLLESNISWAWLLEREGRSGLAHTPQELQWFLGQRDSIWWVADNSRPGQMGFCMSFWDRTLGWVEPRWLDSDSLHQFFVLFFILH